MSVPAPLAALCLRCLEKSPGDRPPSAQALLDEFAALGQRSGGKRLVVGLAGLGCLVGLGGALALSSRGRESSTSPVGAVTPAPTAWSQEPRVLGTPQPPGAWQLPPLVWPALPPEGPPLAARDLRSLARGLAQQPPLAALAWVARSRRLSLGLPAPGSPDAGEPEFDRMVQSLQLLEREPPDPELLATLARTLDALELAPGGDQSLSPPLGEWVLLSACSQRWSAGLGPLATLGHTQRAALQPLLKGVLERRPRPPTRSEWSALGDFAEGVAGRPYEAQPAFSGVALLPEQQRLRYLRVLAELAPRCWELLLLMEQSDPELRTCAGRRFEADILKVRRPLFDGHARGLRVLAQALRAGEAGLQRDSLTGLLLLFLAAMDRTERSQVLRNLAMGSRGALVGRGSELTFDSFQLACLVLGQENRDCQTLLEYQFKRPGRPYPSREESERIYLSELTRRLLEAGLLGPRASAWDEDPGLSPLGVTSAFGGAGVKDFSREARRERAGLYLASWLPRSLSLRVVAREAALLPPEAPRLRQRAAMELAKTDPDLALAATLRAALEGDASACRDFVDLLSRAPLPDPALEARLRLGLAAQGLERTLKRLPELLVQVKGLSATRIAACLAASAAIVRPQGDFMDVPKLWKGRLPESDEAWQILTDLDRELGRRPSPRLAEWRTGLYLPGPPEARLQRGLRRLSARWRGLRGPLNRSLDQLKGAPRREDLLQRAREGGAQAAELFCLAALLGEGLGALELAQLWSGEEVQRPLARGLLQLALEATPRTTWGAAARVAEQLSQPELARALRSLAQAATPEACAPEDWAALHFERERTWLEVGLPSLVELDAWGLPYLPEERGASAAEPR